MVVADLKVWLYEQIEALGFRRYASGHGAHLTLPGVKIAAIVGWRDVFDDEAAVALGWGVKCKSFCRDVREHWGDLFSGYSPSSLTEIDVREYVHCSSPVPREVLAYIEDLAQVVSELRQMSREPLNLLRWCETRMPWSADGGLVEFDLLDEYYAICCMHAMYGSAPRARELVLAIDKLERRVGTEREHPVHSRKWKYLRDVFIPWAERRRA